MDLCMVIVKDARVCRVGLGYSEGPKVCAWVLSGM
jgi:hypothetical protein